MSSLASGGSEYLTAPSGESQYLTAPEELENDSTTAAALSPVQETTETPSLWKTLHSELTNVGKSLKCGICLTTYKNPVLLPCVHAYCRDCILRSLLDKRECPTCKQPTTKRSLVDAPLLQNMGDSYKMLLKSVGLTPIVYDPELVGLTQLVPSQEEDSCPKKGPSLVDCHQHLKLSTAWHDVMEKENNGDYFRQERKRVLEADEKALVKAARRRREENKREDEGSSSQRTVRFERDKTVADLLVEEQVMGITQQDTSIRETDDDQENLDCKPAAIRKESIVSNNGGENGKDETKHLSAASEESFTKDDDDDNLKCKPAAAMEVDSSLQPDERNLDCKPAAKKQSAESLLPDEREENDGLDPKPAAAAMVPENKSILQNDQLQENILSQRSLLPSQEAYEASMEEARDREAANRSGEMLLLEEELGTLEQAIRGSSSAGIRNNNNVAAAFISNDSCSFLSPNTRETMRRLSHEANAVLQDIRQDTTVNLEDTDNDGIVNEVLHLDKVSESIRHDLGQVETTTYSNDTPEQDNGVDASPPIQETSVEESQPVRMNPNETACTQDVEEIFRDLYTVARMPNQAIPEEDKENAPNESSICSRGQECQTDSNKTAEARAEASDAAAQPPDIFQPEGAFAVGTVVQVQSRTWPGVNKPGGVARVTKVHSGGAVTYDVAYILGGKEKNVDASFVSLREEDDTQNETRDLERKSQRIAHNKENEIPAYLLAKLSADGFDVDGRQKDVVYIKTEKVAVKKEKGVKKAAIKKKKTVKVAVKKETPEPRPKATNKHKRALKGKNTQVNDANVMQRKRKRKAPPKPVELTDDEKLELSNWHYEQLLQSRNVVHVVSSSLSEQDQELLDTLCKETKKNQVTVKVTREFHPSKTAICVVPIQQQASASDAYPVSRNRTLKAMRASLAGVPIVSPAWIASCLESKKVVLPSPSMYIRTLVTKTEQLDVRLGVAMTAARHHQHEKGPILNDAPFLPLQGAFVSLCGAYAQAPSPKKADVQLLLRESGSTILTSASMTIKKLKLLGDKSFTVVLLFDASKGNSSLSADVVNEAKSAMERCPGRVLAANFNWLFDSISCGSMVKADLYQPANNAGQELWKLCTT